MLRTLVDATNTAVRNPGEATSWISNIIEAKQRPFSPEHMCRTVADLTETSLEEIQTYYSEATEGSMRKLYNQRFEKTITEGPGSKLRKQIIGYSPWVGLDRIAIYCIVRAIKPKTVVDTGIKWGEGALFTLHALEKNERGSLISFDIGYEHLPAAHPWPTHHSEVGFFVPEDHRDRWDIVIGDAIENIPLVLEDEEPIDIFYHDSKHTYDYIFEECSTGLEYLRNGGILAAEDINGLGVWPDFLDEYSSKTEGDWRYYRFAENVGAEVGVTKVIQDTI